ncbi:MAG: cobalamin-dependent protein [Thermodesulfobacteriota bacterium]|nr:cobalamin-dependent protein [Thermodesulfobacteriota bacterium]
MTEAIEKNMLMNRLVEAVWEHDDNVMSVAMDTVFSTGLPSDEVRHALIWGLEQVRHKLMSNDTSIPEFLLCMDMVTKALDSLSSLKGDSDSNGVDIPLVIGVVEGDPHDLGKNIIAGIYRTSGYQVFDLGREVPKEIFVKAVQENHARVLALSAMMSTTMVGMRDIIQEVKVKSPHTIVIVGGAPLNEVLARSYGADGYAESAVIVLEETETAIKRDHGNYHTRV